MLIPFRPSKYRIAIATAVIVLSLIGTRGLCAVPLSITNAGVSPDATLVAVRGENSLSIKRISDGVVVKDLHSLGGLDQPAWSPDGRYLAGCGSGSYGTGRGHIIVWRTDTWQPVEIIQTEGYALDTAFLPDSHSLFAVSGDASVVLWDLWRHKVVRRYAMTDGRPTSISVAPNGNFFALGTTYRGYVYAIDGRILYRLKEREVAVAVSPDSNRVGCLEWSTGRASEIDLRTRVRHSLPTSAADIFECLYAADGKSIRPGLNTSIIDDLRDDLKPYLTSRRSPQSHAHGKLLPALTYLMTRTMPNIGPWIPVDHISSNDQAAGGDAPHQWPAFPGTSDTVLSVHHEDTNKTDLFVTVDNVKRGYRIPSSFYDPHLSPDKRLLEYSPNIHADPSDNTPIRVLDLVRARLSPPPVAVSYDNTVYWSPDSRYLAVFGEGLDFTKYSTQRQLYCWDIRTGALRLILSAWDVGVKWRPATDAKSMVMDVKTSNIGSAAALTCEFDPRTGLTEIQSTPQEPASQHPDP